MAQRTKLIMLIPGCAFLLYICTWGRIAIDELLYNYDEGVYYYQAERIERGLKPYRHFLTHQPPLYPYILSLLLPSSQLTLTSVRWISVGSWGLMAVIVGVWSTLRFGFASGLLSLGVMFLTPLTLFGLQGTPHSLALLFLVLGIIFFWNKSPLGIAVAGIFFALSFFAKPLTLGVVIAAWIHLILHRRICTAITLGIVFLVSEVSILMLFQWLEEPLFYEVILSQLRRYSGRSGMELFSYCPLFFHELSTRGVSTPLSWNLSEMKRSLFGEKTSLFFTPILLLILIALSLGMLKPQKESRFLTLALLLTLFSFLFLFEPIWDHYCVHFLPLTAFLLPIASSYLNDLLVPRREARLILPLALFIYLGYQFVQHPPPTFNYYKQISTRFPAQVLSFNPTATLLLGKTPACGLVDPLNSFSQRASFAQFLKGKIPSSFLITPESLERCLVEDPSIMILFDVWTGCFLSRAQMEEWEKRYPSRLTWVFLMAGKRVYPKR